MNSALAALIGLVLAIVLIIKKLSPVYSLMIGALVGGLLAGTGLVFDSNQIFALFEIGKCFVSAEMDGFSLITGFERIKDTFSVDIDRHEVVGTGADGEFSGGSGIDFAVKPRRIAQVGFGENRHHVDHAVVKRNIFGFDIADG